MGGTGVEVGAGTVTVTVETLTEGGGRPIFVAW